MSDNLVPLHKRLAEGKTSGIEVTLDSPFKQTGGETPPTGTLKDSQRGISKPRGFHPEPDHG